MRFASVFVPALALVASAFQSADAADSVALPWDGRAEDLTVETLTDKYMTHILTMRYENLTDDPSKWVSIDQTGRSPAFNDDTGVINIAVDNSSIFKEQTTFRRSELVQQLAGNTEGVTFFRTSFMKTDAFVNKYQWQIVFTESHVFTLRIDASLDSPEIQLFNGTWALQWSTPFELNTWYNFGIALSTGAMDLYWSENDNEMALEKSMELTSALETDYEFHFGMLTLMDDGSEPIMVADEQDILAFNGVSVETSVTGASASASAASASESSAASASVSTAASTEDSVAGEASATDDVYSTAASSAASAASTTDASASTTEETASSAASTTDEYASSASTTEETTSSAASAASTTDEYASASATEEAASSAASATEGDSTTTPKCSIRRN